MRKQSLFLLPLALLLWGCPGQSNEEPEPEKVCLLQEQSKTNVYEGDPPQTFSNRYIYNTDNRLIAVAHDSAGVETERVTLTYDTQGNMVQALKERIKLVNEYDSQNRLIKQTKFFRDGLAAAFQETDIFTLSYTSTGNLGEARFYYSGAGTPNLLYTFRYTYTNGNPTHITQLDGREKVVLRSVYTFDAHPAPQPMSDYPYFSPHQAPAANNRLSGTHTDDRGYTKRRDIGYTYHENGYPATAIIKHANNNQEQLAFRYTCD